MYTWKTVIITFPQRIKKVKKYGLGNFHKEKIILKYLFDEIILLRINNIQNEVHFKLKKLKTVANEGSIKISF